MSNYYNPIVRSFAKWRACICEFTGVSRWQVGPHVSLDELIPPKQRRAVWAALQGRGLQMPALGLSPLGLVIWVSAFTIVLCGTVLHAGWGWPILLVLPFIWYDAFRASRPWATELPLCVRTVGDLAVYGLRFADHAASGYRWSRGDVELKVRLIIAENLGLPLDEVKPETRWLDLE